MHSRVSVETPNQRGFTLLEVMITVAIVGVLAAIAVPSYSDYITRSKIIDATTKLGDLRTDMEKYFMDNRTYLAGAVCGVDQPGGKVSTYSADAAGNFDFACTPVTATTYTLTATGKASKGMSGFVYRINQANVKSSAGPAGWTAAAGACWLIRKDGTC